MPKTRSPQKRGLKPGRRTLENLPRRGIEVSLAESDIEYAREITGGNLSAALTMLIRDHKRRNSV